MILLLVPGGVLRLIAPMSRRVSRRFALAGLAAAGLAGPAIAAAPETSLRPVSRGNGLRARFVDRPEAMLSKAGISGDVAWAVADTKSRLRLESVNGAVGLPPASVAKALTALYALEALGGDHRFRTRVIADGPIADGILDGDLILAGGADPTLTTDGLGILAKQLKESGLREVRGNFIVYDGMLPDVFSIDPGQPDQVGYSPAVSGIALNWNRVHFEWRRDGEGYDVSMDARTERYRPEVAMAVMEVVKRSTPIYTFAEIEDRDYWTVASGALGKGGSRWLPVRRPGAYAGDVFRTLARSHGIVLKKATISKDYRGGVVLAQVESDPLWDILRAMLKYSNNLIAETVGMAATEKLSGKPKSLADSAAKMSRWASRRFDTKGSLLVDHSGLGEESKMTADDLVSALVEARHRGLLRPLLKPIPMRDSKGRPDRSSPIHVDAKTGTLNFVSGLAGFVTAADGTELAFAIFAADTEARSGIPREARERPPGARGWNARAKTFQMKLISRWGALYGS